MHVEHHRWYSDRVRRHMDVAVFGHWGVPVMVFPTSNGDAWEYRDRGFVGAVADFIEAGRVKLYTVSANQDDSWFNTGAHPAHRSWAQAQYDAWVAAEAVPFVWSHCRGRQGITALGASLGAYYAVNATLKHPDLFNRCLAFSGVYDMAPHMDGHFDLNLYFNNPVAFVPNLSDGGTLEALRRVDFHFITGTGAWEDRGPSYHLGGLLRAKGIDAHVDDWGPEGSHDWPAWNRQVRTYFSRL
jgi:esterase/lipase superfamily enzyme